MSKTMEHFDAAIEAAIIERTHAAIAASLETERDRIVESVVRTALTMKVEDERYGPKVSYIHKIAKDAIQKVAREAIAAWAAEVAPEMRAELERQLGSVKVRREIASQLVNGLVREAEGGLRYKFSLDINFPKDDA